MELWANLQMGGGRAASCHSRLDTHLWRTFRPSVKRTIQIRFLGGPLIYRILCQGGTMATPHRESAPVAAPERHGRTGGRQSRPAHRCTLPPCGMTLARFPTSRRDLLGTNRETS